MHRSAGEAAGSTNAHDAEDEDEAEEGASAKGNKKTPIDQRVAWFLGNDDDQQCRHCDVVGEVNQCVGQGARQIAGIANDPSSYDHCEYGEDKVGYPHRGFLRLAV